MDDGGKRKILKDVACGVIDAMCDQDLMVVGSSVTVGVDGLGVEVVYRCYDGPKTFVTDRVVVDYRELLVARCRDVLVRYVGESMAHRLAHKILNLNKERNERTTTTSG